MELEDENDFGLWYWILINFSKLLAKKL